MTSADNILAFPVRQRIQRAAPVLTKRVGDTLLERMQQVRGMPYYAPTVQLRQQDVYFFPVNPLAKCFCQLTGYGWLTGRQLATIRTMGMNVEVVRAE